MYILFIFYYNIINYNGKVSLQYQRDFEVYLRSYNWYLMLTLRRNNPYSVEKLSTNIFCIHENDEWEHSPLIYLILGDEKG